MLLWIPHHHQICSSPLESLYYVSQNCYLQLDTLAEAQRSPGFKNSRTSCELKPLVDACRATGALGVATSAAAAFFPVSFAPLLASLETALFCAALRLLSFSLSAHTLLGAGEAGFANSFC